jgi:acyl-CoA thioesterase I
MKSGPVLQRRSFIHKTLKGIFLSGMTPAVIGELFSGCSSSKRVTSGFDADDLSQIKALINDRQKPLKWLFTGDSITQGAKHTLGFRSYPEIFSERVRFEMNRGRDIIINSAISGHVTQNILEDFEWRIKQFHPDIVSIMIGTNDAAASRNISVDTFENNLNMLVQKFRDLSAIPILHTPNCIKPEVKSGINEREQLPRYVEVIQKISERNRVILVDHWKYWEANKDKAMEEKWLNDPLHPNGKGHLEMARLLFRTLSICDDKSFTCSGQVHF